MKMSGSAGALKAAASAAAVTIIITTTKNVQEPNAQAYK